VQLPLSKHVDRLRGGTRHSAALGLAERTDVLCLVVSEERGTISAAANGALDEINSRSELADRIQRFYRSRRALAAPRPLLWRVLRDRRVEKAAAVALALALWAGLALARQPIERSLAVPVELRGALSSARSSPEHVLVKLLGPRHRVLLLDPRGVSVRVAAHAAGAGMLAPTLAALDVRAPEGIEVLGVEPGAITLSISPAPPPVATGSASR
jgi:hypothetical protein